MRAVIVEDQGFYLDLLADALHGRGIDVVGRARTEAEALAVIDETAPDIAVVDIRLSPTRDDDGLRVAEHVRRRYPEIALLVLSAYLEPAYAQRLLTIEPIPRAIGYLGKERLGNLDELVRAFTAVDRGEVVLDPSIIGRLMARPRTADPLDTLTPHERRILSLVAEGRSNRRIAQELNTKISTVERQFTVIAAKLGLTDATDLDRSSVNLRVLATLTYLRGTAQR
ncbi:response regulator transcription factor [Plantactinospora sp. ZYX-F-223]|uniref:response regulator transcription factor n=1 Tax=Plantactinospora sp. ZYX-F-223 TaxID=3144103 RepID=UPI0031FD1755